MAANVGEDIENLKKQLFTSVRNGDWKKVLDICKSDLTAHEVQITKTGHTVLHLAVSVEKEEVVEELVSMAINTACTGTLKIAEEKGHTPLHFAAAIGNSRLCECITAADPSLIGVRNNRGETPLFWTVLFGQREAFFCLNSKCTTAEGYSYCRRTGDGQTILHCAIFAEDFELAFNIIKLYGGLVNLDDVRGFFPLHTLATKPSCFKSYRKIGRWETIIYDRINVDLPEIGEYSGPRETLPYPENDNTFVNFMALLKTAAMRITVVGLVKRGSSRTDTEIGVDEEHEHAVGGKQCSKDLFVLIVF